MSQTFWQSFIPHCPLRDFYRHSNPAPMPDGRALDLPFRDFGEFAVAGLIANQASSTVLDHLAAWTAERYAGWGVEVVVGLPTLGHTVGAAVAPAMEHTSWVSMIQSNRWQVKLQDLRVAGAFQTPMFYRTAAVWRPG